MKWTSLVDANKQTNKQTIRKHTKYKKGTVVNNKKKNKQKRRDLESVSVRKRWMKK